MKKTVAALALGAILLPAAVIAGGHFGEHRADRKVDRMAEHLQLTEQQQAEVKDIFASQREKHMKLRDETHEKIQAILTEEQRATMAKHHEEREGRFCGKSWKGGHGEGYRHERPHRGGYDS
jgi:Spy/CpxP family protein refolding chaperone